MNIIYIVYVVWIFLTPLYCLYSSSSSADFRMRKLVDFLSDENSLHSALKIFYVEILEEELKNLDIQRSLNLEFPFDEEMQIIFDKHFNILVDNVLEEVNFFDLFQNLEEKDKKDIKKSLKLEFKLPEGTNWKDPDLFKDQNISLKKEISSLEDWQNIYFSKTRKECEKYFDSFWNETNSVCEIKFSFSFEKFHFYSQDNGFFFLKKDLRNSEINHNDFIILNRKKVIERRKLQNTPIHTIDECEEILGFVRSDGNDCVFKFLFLEKESKYYFKEVENQECHENNYSWKETYCVYKLIPSISLHFASFKDKDKDKEDLNFYTNTCSVYKDHFANLAKVDYFLYEDMENRLYCISANFFFKNILKIDQNAFHSYAKKLKDSNNSYFLNVLVKFDVSNTNNFCYHVSFNGNFLIKVAFNIYYIKKYYNKSYTFLMRLNKIGEKDDDLTISIGKDDLFEIILKKVPSNENSFKVSPIYIQSTDVLKFVYRGIALATPFFKKHNL